MSNLSDRGTLRGTLQRNSGNYNDLINKPAINGHTLIGNQSGHALGLANEDDIVNVEANPLGHATADLHKILVDDTIYSIPDVVVYGTTSGAIASFNDGGDNKPLKSLKVAINPVQSGSGDPSPENVRPISGWTGANVTRCGANLWDEETINKYISNMGDEYAQNTSLCSKNFSKCNPSTNYYVKSSNNIAIRICWYDKNFNFIERSNNDVANTVVTSLATACYFKISMGSYVASGKAVYNNDISVNSVSTDTNYHAYNGTTYPITWSEAGEVFGGEIDVTNGSATNILNKIVMSEHTWIYVQRYNLFRMPLNGYKKISGSTIPNALCEIAPPVSLNNMVNNTSIEGFAYGATGAYDNNILLRLTDITTAEQLKSVIENKKLIYELATPIPFTLDAPVPTIATLLGDNNIWSDTGEIEECVYQRDLNLAINKALSQ